MTKTQFLYDSTRLVFAEIAKATNQLCGQSKTSSVVANLFVNLPLKVEARFIESQPKPSKKLNAIEEFVTAYMKHDDVSAVYIAFFYSTEKQLTQIMKRITKHPTYFAYLYMREALKVTRLMGTKTHYKMMSGIIKHNNPTISVEDHYRLSLQACDYAVNSTIHKLFTNSAISEDLNAVFETQNYNKSWADDNLSEMDILVKLLPAFDEADRPLILDNEFNYDPVSNLTYPGDFDNEVSYDEAIVTNLGESVTNALATMSRGTGSQAIFEDSFRAQKVKTGWFKKLTAKFTKDVHYMTSTFRAEWSSLNITYRHKFKAPKHTSTDHKLSVVLSIDHSGSVSTEGLAKLLYLFNKHAKRITDLYIIIHDDDIVKEFHITSDFDISEDTSFKKALSNRIACGGTSHHKVFTRIAELIKTKSIDPTKSVYISFSDNYSDIPQSWDATPVIRQIYSTIFLAPAHNPMGIAGAQDISMS